MGENEALTPNFPWFHIPEERRTSTSSAMIAKKGFVINVSYWSPTAVYVECLCAERMHMAYI